MIHEIVFIISSPLYDSDSKRYGVKTLEKSGFKIRFLDISPYINPLLHQKANSTNRCDLSLITQLKDKSQTSEEIKNLPKNCFAVLMLPHYNYQYHHIFRSLSRRNIPYAISLLSYIPHDKNIPKSMVFYKRLLRLNFQNLFRIVSNRIFHPKFSNLLGVSAPSVILLSGKKCLEHQLASLANKNTVNLWLHNYDYDIYLAERNANSKDERIITFIDAPSPRFKFDAFIKGINSPLTEKKYYPALCNFFDELEKKYDAKVIIASHPKSDHSANPDYFGKRQCFSNMTSSLIKKSMLVINRNSTSINFAILYKKPIIFHTSNEIEESRDKNMAYSIRSMANIFGVKPVNIDNCCNFDFEGLTNINNSSYDYYKENYIKKKNSSNMPIWQAFSEFLKND